MKDLREVNAGTVFVELRPGDKVIRREQAEAYREKQAKERRRAEGGNFTFTNMEPMQKLAAEVDALQLGYLFVLQTFIDYDTNILVTGRDRRPMTKDDIQKAMNVGRKVLWEFMKTMELYSVVIQDADGRYVINDTYIFRGSQGNRKRVVKAYDMGVRKAYEVVRSAKKVKQLGYLVKTLPYLHMKNNVICANPFEDNAEKIQAFDKGQIAELLGIDEKTAYRIIRDMVLDDEVVFAEVTRGNYRFYMVNPYICSRGDVGEGIRSLFKVINQGWYIKKQAAKKSQETE